jgi:hypothetical protein
MLETIADRTQSLSDRFSWVRHFSRGVCDPVANGSHTIGGVSVSTFVAPSWFDDHAALPNTHGLPRQGELTVSDGQGGVYVHLNGGHPKHVFGHALFDWGGDTKNSPNRGPLT